MGELFDFYFSTPLNFVFIFYIKLKNSHLSLICNSTSSNFMSEAFSILTR